MSLTVANIVTNFDSHIGDTSTDRVSAAERLQYITEAVVWLQESLVNDHQNATYTLNYFDTIHYYKVTTSIADLLDGADLRRAEQDQIYSFAHKSARELAEEIGQNFGESSWAIERRDGDAYLVVNHDSKYSAQTIASCDTIYDGGGTWAVDTTNSDAANLTIDTNEFQEGTGSFNFDITTTQSGNNRATITNSTLNTLDLSEYNNLASWVMDVYLTSVTNFTSFTFYWGSDSSNYWSKTVTTDYNGSAFVVGWNKIRFDWSSATMTSSPDVTAIDYLRLDLNYTGSFTTNTDNRLDYIRIVRPEKLTYHYVSWNVGTNSGGTDITAFTATTDIPYFSGQYDQYKFAVSHKAAALCLRELRLYNSADREDAEAEKALKRVSKLIPSSRTPEVKSFKVHGVSFRRSKGGRRS